MKVCVLQPDYSTTDVDYKNYDPPRNLAPLLPKDEVTHLFLNKLTTYKQLKQASKQHFDIYVNLCEGYLDWTVPSIDVIQTLELLNLPYTGPNAVLYDPSKPLMKYVAHCAGIKTPRFSEVNSDQTFEEQIAQLQYPLFVKPANAGDSLGIDEFSLVNSLFELETKVKSLLENDFDEILIEEFIEGQEFTVLVAAIASPAGSCKVYEPIEYVFPENKTYKTYSLKTSDLQQNNNIACSNPIVKEKLKVAAEKIFINFGGVGYARLDFRVDTKQEIYFLDINFTCSVFYENGFEGSADHILQLEAEGKSGFLKLIIAEGIERHHQKQKKYVLKGNSINGYGIFAKQEINKNEIIFYLESSPLRIATKRFVESNWNESQIKDFKHYAYPVSDEVFVLWDTDPNKWAPQNHSCQPNTTYDGLNLIALTHIKNDEELTLDYSNIMGENLPEFKCNCGSIICRKIIKGSVKNSINSKELDLKK